MPDLLCDVYSMLRTECKSMAVKCPPDSCPRIVSDAQNHDIQLQDSTHLLSSQLQKSAKPFVNCAWCKRLYKQDTMPYSTQEIHIHCRCIKWQMLKKCYAPIGRRTVNQCFILISYYVTGSFRVKSPRSGNWTIWAFSNKIQYVLDDVFSIRAKLQPSILYICWDNELLVEVVSTSFCVA